MAHAVASYSVADDSHLSITPEAFIA
jgi:hypothetical protein